MSDFMKVEKYFEGGETRDGAGVQLRRTFGHKDVEDFDPFLMMDFFDSEDPDDYLNGFPWHPHRGIETVTYLISGEIEHGDSMKNNGTINDGGCQWMTAGKGIIHQEMPKESPRMLGLQLWVNLPREHKMTEPRYNDITDDMVPKYKDDNMTVKVLAGEYKDLEGPMKDLFVETIFMDVELKPNTTFEHSINPEFKTFTFLVDGEGNFNPIEEEIISYPKGVLYEKGSHIKVNTKDEGCRFLLIAGRPLNEPIAWGGPVVMNTQEELKQAFKEIRENTFTRK